MLAIKLKRIGRRHQPSYRIVVAEKRSKLGGEPVEDIGHYNPFSKTFAVKADRAAHWIKMGAQPTVTVHNLLVRNKIVEGGTVPVRIPYVAPEPVAAPVAAAEPAAAEAAAEAPVPEEEVTA